MYKITEFLATDGIGESYYPMPADKLKTGEFMDGYIILDVRDLKDEANPISEYERKINEGLEIMKDRTRVCVCCGAGQSRSNAIAVGILTSSGMDFNDALKLVEAKVPIAQIDPSHISALKKIFKVDDWVNRLRERSDDYIPEGYLAD